MTLPDDDAHSPLATLRQLKEMLDAGTISQQEFDTLKQRLIFGAAPEAPLPPVPATPLPLAPPPPLPTPYLDGPAALTPEATPLLTPEPDWLPAPAAPREPAYDQDETPAAERRNPLNLVFAIGGLLLFLGAMAYLTLFRTPAPDEHLTSTTQTAADTTTVVPETGPQAEQLTLPPAAAPETLRVAPALPPPTATTPTAADSGQVRRATPAPAAVATPTAAPATTAAPKAAPTKPAATPAATAPDTAATKQ